MMMPNTVGDADEPVDEGDHLHGGVEVFGGTQPQHGDAHHIAAQDAHEVGIDREQGDHEHQGQHARQHQKIYGRDAQGGQGVHLLVDLAPTRPDMTTPTMTAPMTRSMPMPTSPAT